jgi:adenylate cyclase
VTDFTVLGDAANVAARLSTNARAGEILISEGAAVAAHSDVEMGESRLLELKGKSEPMKVWVYRIAPGVD